MAAAVLRAGGMPVQHEPYKTCSDRTKLAGVLAFAIITALGPVLHHFGVICSTSAIAIGAAGGTAFLATLLLLALESRKVSSPIKEDAPELFKAIFQGKEAVEKFKGKAKELFEGHSAIEVAAANGRVEELNVLLEDSEKEHCQKAFLTAVTLGQKEAVLALLASEKVEFSAENNLRQGALVLAVQSGRVEVLRALVDHKDCTTKVINDSGCLAVAARHGSLPLVALLCAQEGIEVTGAQEARFWYDQQVRLLPDIVDKRVLWQQYSQLADLVGFHD